MEKKGEQSANNHSDKDKQKATQAGVSAIPNPDNNQAVADNKTQNKAKVEKANSTKGSKKGVAASNSGGSRTGKGKIGAKSYNKTNKQQAIKRQKVNNKKRQRKRKCFTGDTLICTDKGYRPIKEIRKGDDIYSRNEKTKETGLKKVTNLFKSVANTIHRIWLDGKERIKTTAYHPIFVKGKGWVNAINLQEGNEIETMEGAAQVTRIEKTRHEDQVDVYNVQVEEWETYFVSESQAFVHNCSQRNEHLAGKKHPVTGVKYDDDGYPVFKAKCEVQLNPEDYCKSRSTHKRRANKAIYERAMKDNTLGSKFSKKDLALMREGKTPKGYTWHHHQDPGRMQLVDKKIHKATGHTGGYNIWGGT